MGCTWMSGASPVEVVRYLNRRAAEGIVFFDSGKSAEGEAAWSIVTCRPKVVLTELGDQFVEYPSGQKVADIHGWMAEKNAASGSVLASEAPFQGGLAGFLGFELAWFLREIKAERKVSEVPLLWVGVFEAAACYEHKTGRWCLCGDGEGAAGALLREAIERAEEASAPASKGKAASGAGAQPAELHGVSGAKYAAKVAACIDAIRAGALLQVNYTERFEGKWARESAAEGDGFALFEALRAYENGAYGGFLQADVAGREFTVASVSPEQFLVVENGRVVTRPIKGTRRRGVTAEEDAALGAELLASEKDRGENRMIVELMHEDLDSVCEAGSVETSTFCGLESFECVHHLVSTVEGRLAEQRSALDAFLGCFPAASCIGSPRERAMEWIAGMESSARGPYTGSMFYWSTDGRLDSNVLIRTAVLAGETARYGAGGAVVLDSDPHGEYVEAVLKARPFLNVLGGGPGSE